MEQLSSLLSRTFRVVIIRKSLFSLHFLPSCLNNHVSPNTVKLPESVVLKAEPTEAGGGKDPQLESR